MIVQERMEAQAGLPQVGQALDAPRPGLGASERWQQQRREKGDDGDDCQHLQQCEPMSLVPGGLHLIALLYRPRTQFGPGHFIGVEASAQRSD